MVHHVDRSCAFAGGVIKTPARKASFKMEHA